MMIKDRLLRASNDLARVPSLGWALGYFVVILFFAILYTMNSNGFYHSTSQFESSLNDDAHEIRNDLELLLKSMSSFDSNGYDGWQLVEEEFSVHSIKTLDENLGFTVHVVFEKNEMLVGMNVELYFALTPKLTTCEVGGVCYSTRIMQTVEPVLNKEHNFFALIPQMLAYYGDINIINVPVELDERIKGFIAAKKGFPSEASGSFGRMLYFSVVTITTLGYGDVVPITDINRFLVGLESVMGLVLIGLFLNSLSRERQVSL